MHHMRFALNRILKENTFQKSYIVFIVEYFIPYNRIMRIEFLF